MAPPIPNHFSAFAGRFRRGGHFAVPAPFNGDFMYHSTQAEEIATISSSGPDPVLRHSGNYRRLVDRHQKQVARLFNAEVPDGLVRLWPLLMPRIADARTIRLAISKLDRRKAPGPSGLRLENLESAELWSLSREL